MMAHHLQRRQLVSLSERRGHCTRVVSLSGPKKYQLWEGWTQGSALPADSSTAAVAHFLSPIHADLSRRAVDLSSSRAPKGSTALWKQAV